MPTKFVAGSSRWSSYASRHLHASSHLAQSVVFRCSTAGPTAAADAMVASNHLPLKQINMSALSTIFRILHPAVPIADRSSVLGSTLGHGINPPGQHHICVYIALKCSALMTIAYCFFYTRERLSTQRTTASINMKRQYGGFTWASARKRHPATA